MVSANPKENPSQSCISIFSKFEKGDEIRWCCGSVRYGRPRKADAIDDKSNHLATLGPTMSVNIKMGEKKYLKRSGTNRIQRSTTHTHTRTCTKDMRRKKKKKKKKRLVTDKSIVMNAIQSGWALYYWIGSSGGGRRRNTTCLRVIKRSVSLTSAIFFSYSRNKRRRKSLR